MKDAIHPRAIQSKTARWETPVRLDRFSFLARDTHLGRWSYLSDYASTGEGTRIGRFCSIARYVEIGALDHPTDFLSTHPFQYATYHWQGQAEWDAIDRVDYARKPPTIIEHDVWIGAKAILTRGNTIGTGAVIGAGSFVNRDVPPYAIVAGSPAKLIRHRFAPPVIKRLLASKWWNRPMSELSGLPFDDIEKTLDLLDAMPPAPET